ncbi:MAG: DUF3795 domain-containing protein [Acholeplasmataceae bacterium]|nr:DUF3795 domain-containing protein [Acholeplasmataceae bacterium]
MVKDLIGKYGFYCGVCPTYINGNCKGCMLDHSEGDCYTRDCVLKQKIEYCDQCKKFPCKATVLDKTWLELKKRSSSAKG